jgi:hypothetical protein
MCKKKKKKKTEQNLAWLGSLDNNSSLIAKPTSALLHTFSTLTRDGEKERG